MGMSGPGSMVSITVFTLLKSSARNSSDPKLRPGSIRAAFSSTVSLGLASRLPRIQLSVSVTVSPIRNRAGKIVGASKVGRDITAMRRAQEMQSLLFREMDHRIKNLFAVAGGVVSVSARSATDAKDLAKTVQARLGAPWRSPKL